MFQCDRGRGGEGQKCVQNKPLHAPGWSVIASVCPSVRLSSVFLCVCMYMYIGIKPLVGTCWLCHCCSVISDDVMMMSSGLVQVLHMLYVHLFHRVNTDL